MIQVIEQFIVNYLKANQERGWADFYELQSFGLSLWKKKKGNGLWL